jgi:transposase
MSADKIRRVLRLWSLGKSQSEVAREAQVSRAAVQDYTRRAKALGLTLEEAVKLEDQELLAKLGKIGGHRKQISVEIDYARVTAELGKKGVTLELLFRELLAQGKMPCSYQTFCRRILAHERTTGVVLRQSYAPGEYWFVDYAGVTVSIWNTAQTKVLFEAQVFVGVLGASGLIFAEATESQKTEYFIGSHVRGFEFYGGVPLIAVPDNLKSAVTKCDRFEPELNRAYEELGAHYGMTILPARPRKPRDKGKVERAVLAVERWVLAVLRDEKFSSLAALNVAIRSLVDALNHRQMREYGASRWELFVKIERDALKPLPEKRYEVTTLKLAKVNIDYHIELEKHYYSVPYQLVRQEVWVRASEYQVTIHFGNKCVATHVRSRIPYRYTTLFEHMPSNHQAIRSQKAESFVTWAATIGPESEKLIERTFSLVSHERLAFRSIMGLQRLAKTYSTQAFEAAAKEANGAGVASCKRVKGIIARQYAEKINQKEPAPVVLHANLRDPIIYH